MAILSKNPYSQAANMAPLSVSPVNLSKKFDFPYKEILQRCRLIYSEEI